MPQPKKHDSAAARTRAWRLRRQIRDNRALLAENLIKTEAQDEARDVLIRHLTCAFLELRDRKNPLAPKVIEEQPLKYLLHDAERIRALGWVLDADRQKFAILIRQAEDALKALGLDPEP